MSRIPLLQSNPQVNHLLSCSILTNLSLITSETYMAHLDSCASLDQIIQLSNSNSTILHHIDRFTNRHQQGPFTIIAYPYRVQLGHNPSSLVP